MKKTIAVIFAVITAISMLTGCGAKQNGKTEATAATEVQVEATTEKVTEVPAEATSATEKEVNSKKESGASAELGGKYVDLDNRSFAVNGKVYTLGKSTLQDMIDDGVPFNETDLANANNNLNANTESQSFKIVLGEYYSAQVSVGNFTEKNMTAAKSPLCQVYIAVHQDEEQDIIEFAFPLNITEKELVAQAGEPTKSNEYKGDNGYVSRTVEYKKDSEKYYGSSGYRFEFVNDELRYLTINLK